MVEGETVLGSVEAVVVDLVAVGEYVEEEFLAEDVVFGLENGLDGLGEEGAGFLAAEGFPEGFPVVALAVVSVE